MGKGLRKYFGQRAISNLISVMIMTALVVSIGLATLSWAQGVSLTFVQNYGAAIDADIARLKERLTTEYANYDGASQNVTIYLMNCGLIDDVAIQSINIRNDTFSETSQNLSLKLINDTAVDNLDQQQEGYVELSMSTNLTSGVYYLVTIVTVRGAVFSAAFVA